MLIVNIVQSKDLIPSWADQSGHVTLNDDGSSVVRYISLTGEGFWRAILSHFELNNVDKWVSDVELPVWVMVGMSLHMTGSKGLHSSNRICILNDGYSKSPTVCIGVRSIEISESAGGDDLVRDLESAIKEEFYGCYPR